MVKALAVLPQPLRAVSSLC